MKSATILLFSALLLGMSAITLFGQTPDISGTWVGETDFPTTPDTDPVTLVLKKTDTTYSGTIVIGTGKEVALANVVFEDEDTIGFDFYMTADKERVRVHAKLDVINDKLEGNKLMGSWVIEDGSYGSLELVRKKSK